MSRHLLDGSSEVENYCFGAAVAFCVCVCVCVRRLLAPRVPVHNYDGGIRRAARKEWERRGAGRSRL